jgi:uncharacterized protein YaaQ
VKLVVAIVQDGDAGGVIDALVQAEFRSTRINTSGGFLKRGNATILVGVEDERVPDVLRLIRDQTHGGAVEGDRPAQLRPGTVFVLPVARFVRM